jgi:hypothetical protein
MKRFLLQMTLLMSPFFSYAQGIGYLDLPVPGELWIEFKDTTGANVTISPSGTGQTWNFLNSFTVHDTVQYLPQIISSIPASISSQFPQANLATPGELPGDYTFIKTGLTGMFIDGIHSNTGIAVVGDTLNDINYDVDLLYLPIPFQYGDVVQNTSSYSYVFPEPSLLPDALIRATFFTFQDMETEAQGDLTTPLGNYPSVIRIKEMITKTVLYEIDSFALGNFSFFTDFTYPTTFAYKWLKNGPNCLVMTATADEFNNVTEASYYTSSGLVGLHTVKNTNEISLQPNPLTRGANLVVNFNEAHATAISIFDLSGRNLYQTMVSKDVAKLNINTNMFESGLYYMNVLNGNETTSVIKFAVTE